MTRRQAHLRDVTNEPPSTEIAPAGDNAALFKQRAAPSATFSRKKHIPGREVLKATNRALNPPPGNFAGGKIAATASGTGRPAARRPPQQADNSGSVDAPDDEHLPEEIIASHSEAGDNDYDFQISGGGADVESATLQARDGATAQRQRESKAGGQRYPRKVAPSAQLQEERAGASFLAQMRAHFQQVDEFELAVETPSPAAPARPPPLLPTDESMAGGALADRLVAVADDDDAIHATDAQPAEAAPSPARRARRGSMSFGLSRRRSSIVSSKLGPQRLWEPSRPHLATIESPADNDEADGAAAAAPADKQQPPLPRASFSGRLSIEAGLSRLSLGFSSALQRFGLRSSAASAEAPSQAAEAAPTPFHDAPGVSPIQEGSEAQSSPESALASPVAASPAGASLTSPACSSAASDLPESSLAAAATPQREARADLRAANEDLYASPESVVGGTLERSPSAASSADVAHLQRVSVDLSAEPDDEDGDAEALAELAAESAVASAAEAMAAVEYAEAAGMGLLALEAGPLSMLLALCGQPADVEAMPSMHELLSEHVDLAAVRKVGEGTFGEAFKDAASKWTDYAAQSGRVISAGGCQKWRCLTCGAQNFKQAEGVVFKIVPMEGALIVNGEHQKRASDITAEVEIAMALSHLRGAQLVEGEAPPANVTSGFVETHGVGICRGRYAPALLAEWHAWDKQHGSENDPVDAFPEDQLYIVFVVADGGTDLEHFELRTAEEARSILLQVALAVGVAEQACEFEHRDLHWGNLLIQRGAAAEAPSRLRGVHTVAKTGGLRVMLIDFTLSRLSLANGVVAHCDLSLDPELFQGPRGDCQADTYRRMAKLTGGDWRRHTPRTNTAWMAYLADTLLNLKQACLLPADKRGLRAFKKRALACDSCADLIFDEYFEGAWRAVSA